jgi:hypothetical protein
MKTNTFRIFTAEILILAILSSTYIVPTHALWDEHLIWLTVPPPAPAEYISCPSDHIATNEELASIIGITVDELVAMKRARSLTNETICKLPKARIARSLKKTLDPSKPSIEGFMEWRNESLISGASGTINALNANNANTERQALVVNDWPLINTDSTPAIQWSGAIDKTRWFSLGPNNVSGRIITMFIDPDYPDTLWAGSAGGGLWKSIDNGDHWNPIADFPGNTAISVIKMDPHNHDIMYIGTGDKDLWDGVPWNGIFKSTNRGETWTHVPSTIAENNLWSVVTWIYINPIQSGSFIATWGYSWSLRSDDNMQTWTASTISWLENPSYGSWVIENPYNSGSILINIGEKIYTSWDYGQTFTWISRPGSYGRIELAFGKPNIITLSWVSQLPEKKQISLTNTSTNGDIRIDTVTIDIKIWTGTTVSGELCLRPIWSINSCNTYEKHEIQNTGGLFTFSWISLPYQALSKNGWTSDFEIFLDTQNGGVVSGEIKYNVDHINYESNAELGTEYYISGESYGSGLIYASVNQNYGSLYRSWDLWVTWELVSNPDLPSIYRYDWYGETSLLGNQWSFGNVIWVNPMDFRHIIIGGINLFESRDWWYNWEMLSDWTNGFSAEKDRYISPHADQHSIVADPRFDNINNRKIFFWTDGWIYRANDIDSITDPRIGWDFAGNWLNVTQFYSIAGTGNIVGGWAQDNATTVYNGLNSWNWDEWLTSWDGMDSVIDPRWTFIYGESYYGWYLARWKINNNLVTPELIGFLSGGVSFKDDDAGWIMPILLDPNNSSRMFAGAKSLWLSENVDTENSYDVIFRNIGNPDPLSFWSINSIAISKQDSNRIWASKWDTLYRSMSWTTSISWEIQDWVNVTASNLPKWRTITHIEIDYYNPNKVYITYGGYEISNVWMTENNGVSWVDISANLPKVPIHTIKQFRNNPNYLYVGTEAWLFSSENGGQSWTTTNEWPANSPVFDIEWYNDNTLLIATFGRGAWALDLNNLTIVPPPTISLKWDILTSLSGSQVINHYKDPIKAVIQWNGTVFYTLDSSVPTKTSSGILSGDVIVVSWETMMLSWIVIWTGNTLNLRTRDFAGNWSDMTKYEFKYKDASYLSHLAIDTREPYRAKITFETPISLSWSLFYSTSSGNLSTGSGKEIKTDGKTTETLTLTGLTANTRYYYQIQVGWTWSLSELSPISSFVTLNTTISPDTPLVGNDHSWSLSSSGKVYIIGSTATWVSNIGVSSWSLELIDTWSMITARIPLSGLSISSSGTWDGTLNAPIKIRSATGIQLQSGSLLVDSIYSIGNSTASLSLSGQVATISLSIYWANGTTIKIYRSPDILTPFTEIASCVVANNLCTFTTNHFSLFAIGNPIASSSSIIGGNGWWGPISSSWPNFANIILTPLQIQYAKNTTTNILLKHSEESRILEQHITNLSKRWNLQYFLSQIDYNQDYMESIDFAYSEIVEPILMSIEHYTNNRMERLITYDMSITTLKKKIKSWTSKEERLILTLAVQEVTKERKLFIQSEFYQ